MASDVYSKLLSAPVADNGTITFAYQAGKEADDYAASGHSFYASALQANFPIADDGIAVSFGESSITVTYKGSTTIPAGSKVSLNAVLLAAQEQFGDWEVRDLNAAGDATFAGDVTVTTLLTETNVGAAAEVDTLAVSEHGDAVEHTTVLTLTAFEVDVAGDSEDLAIGALLYTLPEGSVFVESASFLGTVDAQTSEATIADGEIALGTTVGAGAVDTTGEVDAAAENILGPIAVSNGEFDGAAVFESAANTGTYLNEAADKTVFLNIAATWPNVDTPEDPVLVTGTVTIKWRFIAAPAA